MSWFSELFGGKWQALRKRGIFNSAADNADILQGWRFAATMKASTPLEWLLRHGETADVPTKLPRKFGVWVPVTKSVRKLGFRKASSPTSTMTSQVGQVPENGGELLPFLIEYRRIVEAPDNGLNSLRLEALKDRYPQYANVLQPKRKKRKASR